MMISTLNNKRVLIVGAGITGMSVARFLDRNDISFEMVDSALTDSIVGDEGKRPDVLRGKALHQSFSDALFNGFDVIVLSPGVPRNLAPVQSALAHGVDVIGDIELFANAANAPVIAVTGSNGKSTVVSWIADVLNASDVRAILCGNIGTPALDSLTDDAECYVLELSSYQLESTRSLKPLTATVLNVSDDHLDRYDSIEHYAAVKRSVLTLAQAIVVNEDDPRTWPIAQNDKTHDKFDAHAPNNNDIRDCRASQCVSAVSLGIDEPAKLSAQAGDNTRWHRRIHENSVWLCRNDEPLIDQTRLSVPGEHNVLNALSVLALIEPLGVSMDMVLERLPTFTGLPHRTESLGEHKGVRWYNDSKGTNIDACIKAIEAMPGPVILIAGGIGKDADFAELGPAVQARVSEVVLIGQDADSIATALAPFTDCLRADSLEAAVDLAAALASAGDVVLLSPACSSFDMFKSYEHRGERFKTLFREVIAA